MSRRVAERAQGSALRPRQARIDAQRTATERKQQLKLERERMLQNCP